MGKKGSEDRVRHILGLVSSLGDEEKKLILEELTKKAVPISAFRARLSGLEIVTKFLKEEEKKTFKEISGILNRRPSTIYNTYSKSRLKSRKRLDLSGTIIKIPYDIFSERKYSFLETIVWYLRDRLSLSFSRISFILNRSYSTVRTVYKRYKIKNGQ